MASGWFEFFRLEEFLMEERNPLVVDRSTSLPNV